MLRSARRVGSENSSKVGCYPGVIVLRWTAVWVAGWLAMVPPQSARSSLFSAFHAPVEAACRNAVFRYQMTSHPILAVPSSFGGPYPCRPASISVGGVDGYSCVGLEGVLVVRGARLHTRLRCPTTSWVFRQRGGALTSKTGVAGSHRAPNHRFCAIVRLEKPRDRAHWRDDMDSLAASNALNARGR